MQIFKERVRPNVQPHNDDDTWFQNQYEYYLQLARRYRSYNIPDKQWRFEIVRDGTHDYLQIPPSLLAEQQQANSFADPHVAQQGHQMTIGPFYGNATFQNAHYNLIVSQVDEHFPTTTRGYSNVLYGQIDSNNVGAPAWGKQRAIDNDIATAPPSFGLDAFATEQRRYNVGSPQVEARQACRSIAPAVQSTYSSENAPPPDAEDFALPYGRGHSTPSQSLDGTRNLYIPPSRWTRIQDRPPHGLHSSSKDAIGSRQASKYPSCAQFLYVFSPAPKSSRLSNAILGFEESVRDQSEEHMISTAATTPTTPAPPVVLEQVRATPANALKGLRVTDIEAARALARKKEKELFAGSVVEERVLGRQVHTYGPIGCPRTSKPPKERRIFEGNTEPMTTSGETNFLGQSQIFQSALACPTLA